MSDWSGSRWQKAVRDVKEQLQGPGPNMTLTREPVFIRCDRTRPAADVILDPDAQQRVAPRANLSPPPDFSEHRLGRLTVSDSADFWATLMAAESQDKPVAGEAIRDRDACGAWALHVYRPALTRSSCRARGGGKGNAGTPGGG